MKKERRDPSWKVGKRPPPGCPSHTFVGSIVPVRTLFGVFSFISSSRNRFPIMEVRTATNLWSRKDCLVAIVTRTSSDTAVESVHLNSF